MVQRTGKKIKVKGSWTSQGLSQFEYDGWKSVLEMAEKKTDDKLLTRIRGHDLFACEAKYHKNCRMQYMQKAEKWQSTNQEAKIYQINLEAAHKNSHLKLYVRLLQKDVFQNVKILKLSDLRKIYIDILEDGEHRNPDYRSRKLKHKLESHEPFKDKLSFCDMGKFQSYILFSSDIDTHTAVKHAFELASMDMIETTGTQLRQSIFRWFLKGTGS